MIHLDIGELEAAALVIASESLIDLLADSVAFDADPDRLDLQRHLANARLVLTLALEETRA